VPGTQTAFHFRTSVSLAEKAFVDHIRFETCGLLTVSGWASAEHASVWKSLVVRLDGNVIPAACSYGQRRPDIASQGAGADRFWGFSIEHFVPPGEYRSLELLRDVNAKGAALFRTSGLRIVCASPDYGSLRTTDEVWHRDRIYGSGLPPDYVNEELRDLAESLDGRILDFGCGSGVLVRTLREQGKDAQGLEIDRPEITGSLRDEIRPHIRLYDGAFPVPYADREFDWVICSEVLEHIPDYGRALAEIARVSRRGILITVPDMSAIPILHKHNVVPWHLLESTHVNFFTQHSLQRALEPYFSDIVFLRTGLSQVNLSNYWVSLAVIARHSGVGH
jgi:SAM-dependent methyltransferase